MEFSIKFQLFKIIVQSALNIMKYKPNCKGYVFITVTTMGICKITFMLYN